MAWKRIILFLFIFSVVAEATEFKIDKISDLDAPWGSTFISIKELLITEKSGKIKLVNLDTKEVSEINHNLNVLEDGQGGLLDILYRDNIVFVSYSEDHGKFKSTTSIARGSFRRDRIAFKNIFVAQPPINSGYHFGSRLAIKDDFLFASVGERGQGMIAQDPTQHPGSIIRIKLSKEAKEKALSELKKLRNMSPMSAEATVVRSYIDWLVSIPWKKTKKVKTDIVNARKILDDDHYGLEKVKDRIIEFLAVQKRIKEVKGPILCLVGPPGVGKTSLGKSIAEATGRQYIRMALGGVRDEAEIRGHRRTYIGSLPGKIIHGMKKSSSVNPLFLLDEIDKLGNDYRGDPSSALLEVLDPEQNKTFQDHYLEVDYDLSKVFFITTSNTLNMPQALLDRMEVIRLSGYTEDEKLEIAKRHLSQKQMDNCKLKQEEFSINDEALKMIIQSYTREAGVRNLERQLAKLTRKVVTLIEKNETKSISVNKNNLPDLLGVPIYQRLEIEKEDLVGITTGLAWTEVGGELLSIEAVKVKGKGKVTATGKLGDVMKESVQAAEFFIRSKAFSFGLDPFDIEKLDVHVHVPEGATPKDGPSAGVAMVTSIVSALTEIKVKNSVGMTGEITLRGRVLPIGG
jgi:ATP-dependent Lon protease